MAPLLVQHCTKLSASEKSIASDYHRMKDAKCNGPRFPAAFPADGDQETDSRSRHLARFSRAASDTVM